MKYYGLFWFRSFTICVALNSALSHVPDSFDIDEKHTAYIIAGGAVTSMYHYCIHVAMLQISAQMDQILSFGMQDNLKLNSWYRIYMIKIFISLTEE